MHTQAKVETKAGAVIATLTRDQDGFQAVVLSGASGQHTVTTENCGGMARAEGHAVGFLQEACYGLSTEEARALGKELIARLAAQVDAQGRPLLSVSVTTSTGYVRVWGRNRAGKQVKVGMAKAHRPRRGAEAGRQTVSVYIRQSLPAYLAAAAEAARDTIRAAALHAREHKVAVAAGQRRARGR
jgi:hypothetical protein